MLKEQANFDLHMVTTRTHMHTNTAGRDFPGHFQQISEIMRKPSWCPVNWLTVRQFRIPVLSVSDNALAADKVPSLNLKSPAFFLIGTVQFGRVWDPVPAKESQQNPWHSKSNCVVNTSARLSASPEPGRTWAVAWLGHLSGSSFE